MTSIQYTVWISRDIFTWKYSSNKMHILNFFVASYMYPFSNLCCTCLPFCFIQHARSTSIGFRRVIERQFKWPWPIHIFPLPFEITEVQMNEVFPPRFHLAEHRHFIDFFRSNCLCFSTLYPTPLQQGFYNKRAAETTACMVKRTNNARIHK